MKQISSLHGTVGIRYSSDESGTETGMLTRDFLAFIGTTWTFAVKPEPPQSLIAAGQFFIFQAGAITIGERKIPIVQLTHVSGGNLSVTAKDTDLAGLALDEIVKQIDKEFRTKIGPSERARFYQSSVVVEFDPPLEKLIGSLQEIQNLLHREIPRDHPFPIKRLAFGDSVPAAGPMNVDALLDTDFSIERRTGEPIKSNRYFCSGPAPTKRLWEILSLIENTLSRT